MNSRSRRVYVRTTLFTLSLFSHAVQSRACEISFFADVCRHEQETLSHLPKLFFVKNVQIQSDISLDDYIKTLIDIPQNALVTREKLLNACFYLKQWGRFDHINVQLTPLKQENFNAYTLTFNVHARPVVDRIVFPDTYWNKAYIKNLYLIEPGNPFDEKKHAESMDNIRRYYHDLGYLNALVTDEIFHNQEKKSTHVAIRIKKGTKKKIKITQKTQAAQKARSRTHITGNSTYSEQELLSLCAQKHPTMPLAPPILAHEIREIYTEHGMPNTYVDLIQKAGSWVIKITEDKIACQSKRVVRAQERHTDEPRTHVSTLLPKNKNQAHTLLGKTIVHASQATNLSLILAELGYKENDPLNAQAIDRAINNIGELGVFESVSLAPLPSLDPLGRQPMSLALVQEEPYEAHARLGASIGNKLLGTTYTAGATISYKNITDHVNHGWLDVQLSRFCQEIGAHYVYPHVHHYPLWFSTDLTYRHFNERGIGASNPLIYIAQTLAALCNLDYHPNVTRLACTCGLQNTKLTHIKKKVANALDLDPACAGKNITYALFQPQIQLKWEDETSQTRSLTSKIQLDVHGAIQRPQQQSFAKILWLESLFVPILPTLDGIIRLRLGHIFTKNWRAVLPPERFYLGGPNSIRSYQPDYAPPYGFYNKKDGPHVVAQGGKSLFNVNIELRAHIKNLTVAPFYDIGWLTNPMHPRPCMAQGLGVGLCYNTRLSPLRFDIGWKLESSNLDHCPYAWFLSFGHAF